MLGKAMRFVTVCALAFAICGKATRHNCADVSKGTAEDLEHRFRQETNFEDHLSTTSSWSRARRLAEILALSSAVTSADAFAPRNVQSLGVRPFQKDSNTAFAPILTNNPLYGTHDMLRPVNANRANPNLATPQVSLHDMKLYGYPNRDVEAFLAGVNPLPLAGLEHPTPADVEAFRSLNKQKDCKILYAKESAAHLRHHEFVEPQFNVFLEYTGRLGQVAKEFNLSPEEQAALWTYTHTDADIINQIARGASAVGFSDDLSDLQGNTADLLCSLTKEDMLPWLKILQAGLGKMPIAAPGRLYRGVGFNAEGTPGSMAPITGFSSFSENLNVAEYFAEETRKDGIQPTIFVMDEHSSGVSLYAAAIVSPDHQEVVFRVGTKFVIEENEQVQREVEALWRKNLASSHGVFWFLFKKQAVPDFKVLVVKEVPTAFSRITELESIFLRS